MQEVTFSIWEQLSENKKKKVNKIIFPGKVKQVNRPTMAFATMCKNEEHCIGKTLDAIKGYIDYLVVADNGSEDGTFDIVKSFFLETGLPGSWHLDKWYGFDQNKTLMMSYVKDKTDYVMHLDADDFLVGDFRSDIIDSGIDQYFILNKRGESNYWCSVIYNNRLTWKFCGVAHTIIKCLENKDLQIKKIEGGDVYIDNTGIGARVLDPEKFLKDAKKLESQYWETLVVDPDNLNSRSAFYCAQSYRDQGGRYLVDALKWYSKYITLKATWIEEEYIARLEIADLQQRINNNDSSMNFSVEDVESSYLNAISIINDRAEAYFQLGKLYNYSKQYQKAYDILLGAKKILLSDVIDKYQLFINEKQYGLWINDELAVSCYYLKRKAEGVNLINEVIELQEHKYRKKHYIKSLEYFNQL
jgi:hypothetical protein